METADGLSGLINPLSDAGPWPLIAVNQQELDVLPDRVALTTYVDIPDIQSNATDAESRAVGPPRAPRRLGREAEQRPQLDAPVAGP